MVPVLCSLCTRQAVRVITVGIIVFLVQNGQTLVPFRFRFVA